METGTRVTLSEEGMRMLETAGHQPRFPRCPNFRVVGEVIEQLNWNSEMYLVRLLNVSRPFNTSAGLMFHSRYMVPVRTPYLGARCRVLSFGGPSEIDGYEVRVVAEPAGTISFYRAQFLTMPKTWCGYDRTNPPIWYFRHNELEVIV